MPGIEGEAPEAFMAVGPGESTFCVGGSGAQELDAHDVGGEAWIFDNGGSCHMPPSAHAMSEYHDCNIATRTARGERYLVEGCGDLALTFPSRGGLEVKLRQNVANACALATTFFRREQWLTKVMRTLEGQVVTPSESSQGGRCFPVVGDVTCPQKTKGKKDAGRELRLEATTLPGLHYAQEVLIFLPPPKRYKSPE